MVDVKFATSLQIMLSLGVQAREHDSLATSQQLAATLGTNPALVRKLLIPLAQAGLVETFKGKTGGVRIAKSPKQITLREIYEASVEKNIACARETSRSDCPVGACMKTVFTGIVTGMEKALGAHLETKTLQHVLNQAKL